jgi:hypothetical protein
MHHCARRTKTDGVDGGSVVMRGVALAHWDVPGGVHT